MATHKRTAHPSRASLDITIRWGADVLGVWHLSPPRTFWIGSAGADAVLPDEALGVARAPLVVVDDDGRVRLVLLESMRADLTSDGAEGRAAASAEPWAPIAGARSVALAPGGRAEIELGEFRVAVALDRAVPSPVRRFHMSRRMIPFQGGSVVLHAAALVVLAMALPPDVSEVAKIEQDQVYLMRHYLRASAETESELEAPPEGGGRGRESGAASSARNSRFGVIGPSAPGAPHVARAAVLRDAAEFGMIGLGAVPAGAPAPAVQTEPWQRDKTPSVARDERNAEENRPGSPPDDAVADQQEQDSGGVNPPTDAAKDRISTFAVDVDTGSYSMARKTLSQGSMPPSFAVRPEEFVNAFDYRYPGPRGSEAFAVHLAAAPSPYTPGHHLLRVGVQGRRVAESARSPAHLVYLVDTSGSMQSEDKMGLVKKSLQILTGSLKAGDTVALSTYAGDVREVLPPTGMDQRARILAAIDDLTAGGSTAMASGIDLAYRLAERTLVKGHINRVIILSDGDANVGPSSTEELNAVVARYKKKGITLSTVGFGQGNYRDQTMEQLADKGDGNYAYIDGEREARRVFAKQLGATLEVIARDVKIQVDFDPAVVAEYRLIGYENRDVADKDFRNDNVDGGEIGAGHSVTAIYDVLLRTTQPSPVTVRVRHKEPLGSEAAAETSFVMAPSAIASTFESAPEDFRFASAVAGFADVLRKSQYVRSWRLADVARIASAAAGDDEDRRELVELVRTAMKINGARAAL